MTSTWSSSPSTRWRRAGCTTSSAAASIATRPTSAGSCRTSRRCSTTTRSSCRCTSKRIKSPARASTPASPASASSGWCARCKTKPAATTRPKTPTAKAWRGSSTFGRRRRGRRASRRRGGAFRVRVRRQRRRQLGRHQRPQPPRRPRVVDGRARRGTPKTPRRRARSASTRDSTTKCSPVGTRSW